VRRAVAAAMVAALACTCGCGSDSPKLDPGPVRWLKGQLHAHSANSMDSAEAPPSVQRRYAELGFDFVVFTDHNYVTETAPVDGVLAIRGVELTQNLRLCDPPSEPGMPCLLHASALFVDGDAPARIHFNTPFDRRRVPLLQRAIDVARERGGLAMINHPNYHYAIDAAGIAELARGGATLLEIANQHPRVNNRGDATHPDTEALWDAAMSEGVTLWGVATDDAHHYSDAGDYQLASGLEPVTPGRGWVMVRASLDPASIRDAVERGDFYATTGVELARAELADGALHIAVADDQTAGPYWIRFIGQGGRLLREVPGPAASFRLADAPPGYLRADITSAQGKRAWVQPVRTP